MTLQAVKRGYRGYVSARPFGTYNIPVPIQSLVLREYCAHGKLFFVLPANEPVYDNSYMVLDGMIRNLQAYEGIVMCSMHMLPQRRDRRGAMLEAILDQGCAVHFALETTFVTNKNDIARLEDFLEIPKVAAGNSRLADLRAVLKAEPSGLDLER